MGGREDEYSSSYAIHPSHVAVPPSPVFFLLRLARTDALLSETKQRISDGLTYHRPPEPRRCAPRRSFGEICLVRLAPPERGNCSDSVPPAAGSAGLAQTWEEGNRGDTEQGCASCHCARAAANAGFLTHRRACGKHPPRAANPPGSRQCGSRRFFHRQLR